MAESRWCGVGKPKRSGSGFSAAKPEAAPKKQVADGSADHAARVDLEANSNTSHEDISKRPDIKQAKPVIATARTDRSNTSKTTAIAIPTLTQYTKLARLCTRIMSDYSETPHNTPRIFIIDNGGNLLLTSEGKTLATFNNISIATPDHNLGVAGSWNVFASQLGKCIIANDDVVFGKRAVDELENASQLHPEAVIIENDHPVGGFSTFLLNNPEEWLRLGGFDELLNPAYFEDNDARIRLKLAGKPTIRAKLSDWRHDNSSTLNNSGIEYQRMHWCLFRRNRDYYILKWGGVPGSEIYQQPFGGFTPTKRNKSGHLLSPISLGELIDKITILQIKTNHLQGKALVNAQKELTALQQTLNALGLQVDQTLIQRLKEVNQDLWQIEDAIRDQERQKSFGETFIRLARSVYQQNDRRSAIKKEINTTYGSALVEEKAYQAY